MSPAPELCETMLRVSAVCTVCILRCPPRIVRCFVQDVSWGTAITHRPLAGHRSQMDMAPDQDRAEDSCSCHPLLRHCELSPLRRSLPTSPSPTRSTSSSVLFARLRPSPGCSLPLHGEQPLGDAHVTPQSRVTAKIENHSTPLLWWRRHAITWSHDELDTHFVIF